jgi:non-ribosomal peptide synthetase component E (peptide arylation enzyme)
MLIRSTWAYTDKKDAGVPHLHVPSQKKMLGCRICAFIITKNADMPYLQVPSQKKRSSRMNET